MRVMNTGRVSLNLIIILTCLSIVSAQDTHDSSPEGIDPLLEVRTETTLYSGPGVTYRALGEIDGNETLDLLARNRIGNWVELRVQDEDDADTMLEGWALTGALTLDETIHFSDVQVDATLTDAAPYNVDDARLAQIYSVPVIPVLDERIRRIYEQGQREGRDSTAITKIGDSLSVSPVYLTPMWRDDHRLGAYDYLAEVIDYFGDSTQRQSVAARIGLNTNSIFDPMWADQDSCEVQESPLLCEYRLANPGIAFIMFGPNDVVSRMTVADYDEQMRLLVETTLEAGIIPVLSTFSTHPESQWYDKSMDFNLALVGIADDYAVPIMNLWLATRALPNYGLAGDNIHMMHGTFEYFNFTTGHEATIGISLQNLVSLATLHELYTFLEMGA